MRRAVLIAQRQFLSTPSARRATTLHPASGRCSLPFLSTPSARRATSGQMKVLIACEISIHALREEGDPRGPPPGAGPQISIHALREEGDGLRGFSAPRHANFYPRPPRGGRRR